MITQYTLTDLIKFILIGCLITGCRSTSSETNPVITPTPIPVPTYTPTTAASSIAAKAISSPTPAAAHPTVPVLPVPLYFLNTDGQIMRLETDAVTLRQVTTEAAPVTSFDVDPTGTYLVYVSDNNLIRADLFGQERPLLFAGGPRAEDWSAYSTTNILGVAFAPDGKQVAFARNGIQLIHDITSPDPLTTMATLLPNVTESENPMTALLPNNTQPKTPFVVRHYLLSASSWSPDGTKLLLTAASPGDSFSKVIFDLQSDQLIELTIPTAKQEHERSLQINLSCYTPTLGGVHWSRTAEAFFIANDVYGMYGPPGLSMVSAVDGVVRPLFYAYTACHPDVLEIREETMRFFRAVHQTKTGDLWGFVNPSYDPNVPGILPLQMAHIDPLSGRITPMREDIHYLDHEILWADDDSGAMVIVRQRKGDILNEEASELTWLPSNGTPAVNFNIDGQWMQWARLLDK